MVREINGLNGSPVSTTSADQSTRRAEQRPSAAPADSGQQGGSSDEVQLSNEARTLQALTDRIQDLPEVNVERAESIRSALESGEFQIDDLVVADKILGSEALFGK